MKERTGQMCPVCGKYQFFRDDDFEICPECGWEDDIIQREDPDYAGGANRRSLNEYKKWRADGYPGRASIPHWDGIYKEEEEWEDDEWADPECKI